MEGAAPLPITVIAAAFAAFKSASGTELPFTAEAIKYPVNVSPAAVVSTASTQKAGCS